ncbi:hypothetical protein WJ18_25735 [Burkholderia vietnamiensis]|nr:hypothetical protein WJ18_25735 [Burkholderia vietnamiensis]
MVRSVTAPDRQMVVVPAMSTSATTDIAKVSFTVLASWWMSGGGKLGLTRFPTLEWSVVQAPMPS